MSLFNQTFHRLLRWELADPRFTDNPHFDQHFLCLSVHQLNDRFTFLHASLSQRPCKHFICAARLPPLPSDGSLPPFLHNIAQVAPPFSITLSACSSPDSPAGTRPASAHSLLSDAASRETRMEGKRGIEWLEYTKNAFWIYYTLTKWRILFLLPLFSKLLFRIIDFFWTSP